MENVPPKHQSRIRPYEIQDDEAGTYPQHLNFRMPWTTNITTKLTFRPDDDVSVKELEKQGHSVLILL
jgi:hypothetical protein